MTISWYSKSCIVSLSCYSILSNKFLYCVQSGLLKRLLSHCAILQPVLSQLCSLVARDAFTQSLVTLGLLDPGACSATHHVADNNHSTPNKSHSHTTPKHHGYKVVAYTVIVPGVKGGFICVIVHCITVDSYVKDLLKWAFVLFDCSNKLIFFYSWT